MSKPYALALTAILLAACSSPSEPAPPRALDHPRSALQSVAFADVKIEDAFWAPRIETIQSETLPDLLELGDAKIRNFAIVGGLEDGKLALANAPDSDIHKLVEAAAYTLAHRENPVVRRRFEEIIGLMEAAQGADGYLNTQYMLPFEHPASPPRDNPHVLKFGYGPQDQWNSTVDRWPYGYSQLYVAGHLMEAAVAWLRATGDDRYLGIARRMADNLDRHIDQSQPLDYADHPQVEIGLFKLYEATGERRYLDLARFIVRNAKFHRPPDIGDGENAKPLWEQRNAFGHCVRTMYVYSGATDMVRALGDTDLKEALLALWQSVAGRKMYVHGGIGNGTAAEQHGLDYDLPPERAYSESCASIAMAQWNHRLNLLTGDAKFADLVELEAYNSALAGISLEGKSYYYCNRLAVGDEHDTRRRYLFCCPSKLPGFVAGIGRWVYARSDDSVAVNLWVSGAAEIPVAGGSLRLRLSTQYPWEGEVEIAIEEAPAAELELKLRIPGWARNQVVPTDLYHFSETLPETWTVKVNGERIAVAAEDGYANLRRRWAKGDRVRLELPMPIRRIEAHPNVTAAAGQVALMRGPLIYALEAADNQGRALDVVLPPDAELRAEFRADLLGGLTVLRGPARLLDGSEIELLAIPYHAWDNRSHGEMTIWIPQSAGPAVQQQRDRLRRFRPGQANTNG